MEKETAQPIGVDGEHFHYRRNVEGSEIHFRGVDIRTVEICECGATREVIISPGHSQRGAWMEPAPVVRQDLRKAIRLLSEYQALCDCSAVAGMSWHAEVDALREKYPLEK